MSVIFITEALDLYGTLFSDLGRSVSFPYPEFASRKGIETLLYRVSHSDKLGGKALKSWVRYALRKSGVVNGDTVIFNGITVRSPIWTDEFILECRRKKCTTVLLMLDSIASNLGNELQKKIFSAASLVDEVYTLDVRNASEYTWHHTNHYYSRIQDVKPTGPKTDVFCVMWNGGRLSEAVSIYDKLESRGIKCSFFIAGANDDEVERFKRDGITYNKWISYKEIVGRILQTKVILDLVRTAESGNTLRPFEAAVYNKRLLTNASYIKEFPFYRDDYIKSFSDVDDIDKLDNSFFTSPEIVDYRYDGRFSPTLLLEQIEEDRRKNDAQ